MMKKGFTLIEMMVAVSIFAAVMMVGVGALLSLVQANARAQGINSVMNNLNAALENMSRTIRVGTSYHCATNANDLSNTSVPLDCGSAANPTPGKLLAFVGPNGDTSNLFVYRLNGTQLERSTDSGSTFVALTAPEVVIDQFDFYVTGAARGDGVQPRVLMRIHGYANTPGGTGQTDFTVQASVAQRLLDI